MATDASPQAARQADGNAFAASAAGATARTAPPKVTPVPIPKPGSQPSAPGVPLHSAHPAAAPTTANERVRLPANPLPGASAAARPNIDALRPIIQDGRVRSPMPGKLKGKMDQKNGMFSVMLMAGPTTSDISLRDAEAKRASESTQAAAELALAAGQGTTRTRKFVRIPADPNPAPPSSAPPPAPQPPPAGPPPAYYGLTDEGIKHEQARLLTLLRSLNPVTVVDQVCKALAYFGGIPDAPPPPAGAFPVSDKANGSGRAFVSWIAEIFPPVPSPDAPPPPAHGAPPPQQTTLTQEQTPEPGQRKRGRPKGSKSARPRKDKGIKKGPVWARPDPSPVPKPKRPRGRPRKNPPLEDGNPGDQSWVDVDDQDDEEHAGDADGHDQDQAQGPVTAYATSEGVSSAIRTALPSGTQAPESETNTTPKRRGKPKVAHFAPIPQPSSSQALQAVTGTSASFTPVNSASQAPTGVEAAAQPGTAAKKRGGRVKGSKNKPKAGEAESTDGANGQPTADRSSGPSIQQPVTTAQGRKRKSVNSAAYLPTMDGDTQAIAQQALHTSGLILPTNSGASAAQQGVPLPPASDLGPSLAPPPAKRQRKSKATKANAVSTEQTESHPAVVDTSNASDAAPEQFEHTFQTTTEETADEHLSLDVDHAISSLQSPTEDSHFDVTSPTMENYQAQLQAQPHQPQVEQESERDASPVDVMEQHIAVQSRVDPRQLMANQLQQQHYQQTQYQRQQQQRQQQRQQQTQQPQQSTLQVSASSGGHARSPSLQQQHATASQQDSARSSQPPATRASQPRYPQYGAGTQFVKPQSYSPQQATAQTAQSQQYSSATQQQQYNNTAQPPYTTGGQSQYTSGSQQQQNPTNNHPRYPQQLGGTGGAGSSSYNTANNQSPQFPSTNMASSTSAYHGGGSTSNVNFANSSYSPLQRSMTASTGASNNGYRSSNTTPVHGGGSSQAAAQHQHQRTSSSTSSQSLQHTAGIQGGPFAAAAAAAAAANNASNAAADWGELSSSAFTTHSGQSGMGGYDPSLGGPGNDTRGFYGVGRR